MFMAVDDSRKTLLLWGWMFKASTFANALLRINYEKEAESRARLLNEHSQYYNAN